MLVVAIISIMVLILVMGIVCYIEKRKPNTSVSGTLKIDTSDPDGPYLFVELNEDVRAIQDQEYVTFKVDISGYASQD